MKLDTRLTAFLMAATLTVGLVGCGPQSQPATAPTTAPAAAEGQPAATEPAATPASEATAAEQPAQTTGEGVTLRYANWNLGTEEENNIQRQLVKAYTDANPNVTIEFVDMSGEGGWDDKLTNYAARGALPDVFMANNVPLYVSNGWLADLTDLVKDDPDWQSVPQVLKDGGTYDGKVLALPAAQFVMGYFVNKDLFEAANLDAPEYGVSAEDFLAAATSLNNPSKAVLGLDEQEFVMGWYGHTQDPNLKWFSFDGEKMNYNSAAFKAAVAKASEIKPLTWQGLTEEQRKNFKSQGPWELFLNQEAGVRWEGGWAVPNFVQNATFDWDFVGIPGGTQALVADYFGISKTAPNLEEAFKFAKWMTFSSEAYAKEAELARAANTAPKMPVSVTPDSIALYKEFADKPGVLKALDNLDNSLVESLAKITPGYINARWEGKPGVDIGDQKDVNVGAMFGAAVAGNIKYEDYSAQLEEFSNKILADARAALKP